MCVPVERSLLGSEGLYVNRSHEFSSLNSHDIENRKPGIKNSIFVPYLQNSHQKKTTVDTFKE